VVSVWYHTSGYRLAVFRFVVASIIQRAHSSYWHAKFRNCAGRQVLRSTKILVNPHKLAGETTAVHAARRRENRRAAYNLAHDWEETARGNRTEAQVRKVFTGLSRAAGRQVEFPSCRDYIESWLLQKEHDVSPGTFARYQGTCRFFLRDLAERDRENLYLEEITPQDVETFKSNRLASGIRHNSVRADVKTLRSVFSTALKQGKILHNPAEAVEVTTEADIVRRPLSADQIEKILAAAAGTEWETAILLGAFQGFRLRDSVDLGWDSYDPLTRTITLVPQKGKRRNPTPFVLPVHPRVETHLSSLPPPENPDAPLCPTLCTLPTGGPTGLSARFASLLRKAGIKQASSSGRGSGRTRNAYSFHSLRHAFVSHLANAGVPEEIRMKLSAHMDRSVHSRYTHHEQERLRSALVKI
jgi:integrase